MNENYNKLAVSFCILFYFFFIIWLSYAVTLLNMIHKYVNNYKETDEEQSHNPWNIHICTRVYCVYYYHYQQITLE